jgi:hypothetical protein
MQADAGKDDPHCDVTTTGTAPNLFRRRLLTA